MMLLAKRFSVLALAVAAHCCTAVGVARAQGLSSASPPARRTVRFLAIPHRSPPLDRAPTKTDIEKFVADPDGDVDRGAHTPVLENEPEELLQDIEFARAVLGQKLLFQQLGEFSRGYPEPIQIHVRFISARDWLARLRDETSGHFTPFACHLGDTWEAWFKDLKVLQHVERESIDLRLIWYHKDLVLPDEIAQMDSDTGFRNVLQRVRSRHLSKGIVPFAIPADVEWDVLWNLHPWILSAGGDLARKSQDWSGAPTLVAALDEAPAQHAARYLTSLVEDGSLVVPSRSHQAITDEFLARKFAMVQLHPWVAWQAEVKLGSTWHEKIGVMLPPSLGAERRTFQGGWLIGAMATADQQNSPEARAAAAISRYLTSPEVQRSQSTGVQILPGNLKAWDKFQYAGFFKEVLQKGVHPVRSGLWAQAGESSAVQDALRSFWHRLGALSPAPAEAPAKTDGEVERKRETARGMVLEALHSADAAIEDQPSPHREPRRILIAILITASVTAAGVWGAREVSIRRQRRRWQEDMKRMHEMSKLVETLLKAVKSH